MARGTGCEYERILSILLICCTATGCDAEHSAPWAGQNEVSVAYFWFKAVELRLSGKPLALADLDGRGLVCVYVGCVGALCGRLQDGRCVGAYQLILATT